MTTRLFYSLLFTFVCLANLASAQHIDLPEFETPEKTFYKLLEEKKIKFPKFNNGRTKSVKRIFNTYENGKINATETEVTIFDRNKVIIDHYFIHDGEKFDDFSTPPIQYKDSIEGGIRINIPEDENSFKDYFYNSGMLVKYVNKAEDYYQVEGDFNYNADEKLVKSYKYNYDILVDNDNEAIAAAKVMSDAKIASYKAKKISKKESFEIWEDILNYQKIDYIYNVNNQLESYTYSLKSFSTDSLQTEVDLENQKLSDLKELEDNRKNLEGKFQYNNNGKIKSFQLLDSDSMLILEDYQISYQPNYMTIIGKFPKGDEPDLILKYEYVFDKLKNPISIKSYYKLGETFILDKETLVEITYYQD